MARRASTTSSIIRRSTTLSRRSGTIRSTPSFLNELRVNAAGWRWNEISTNPQSPVGLPTDSIDQEGSLGGGTPINSFGPNVGSILNQWTYSYKDVATKIYGRHTLKFGGEVTRLFYLNDCVGCGVPSYNFFNIWDFLNDAPHIESGGFNPLTGFPTTQRQDDRENIWGVFFQDDLKVTRNLTAESGSPLLLLWSAVLQRRQHVPGDSRSWIRFSYRSDRSARETRGIPRRTTIGPELGFAWSPSAFHDKLVVRGGYGLNYSQEEIAISANINANPGLIVFPTLSMSTPTSPNPGIIYAPSSDVHSFTGYPENPNTLVTFGANGLPAGGTGLGVSIFPNTLPTLRVHHYSLDTQYDLGHKIVASVGYQGSVSKNIFFHQNPNAAPAAFGVPAQPANRGR